VEEKKIVAENKHKFFLSNFISITSSSREEQQLN